MSTVRPKDRIQARRWGSFSGDIFYRIVEWPDQLIRLALKQHLTNMERYFLFTFLVHNGADPDWAAERILETNTYDGDAIRHVSYLKQNWVHMPVRYWDMQEHKYVQYDGRPGQAGEDFEDRDMARFRRAERRAYEARMAEADEQYEREREEELEFQAAERLHMKWLYKHPEELKAYDRWKARARAEYWEKAMRPPW